MSEQLSNEFFNIRAELVKERAEFEDKYGEYKDPTDKLATVFHFKPTDFLLKDFYFTLEGVTLSLPYPSLSTFNHIINIVPKEPTKESLAMWAFYSVWILAVCNVKGEEWLSFRRSYEQGIPDSMSTVYAHRRMKTDIKKRLLPRSSKRHIKLLFEGFVLLMDDIGERMGSEKLSDIEYKHCYTLMGECESFYSVAKDFGMLPHVFMDSVNVAEFAAMVSSIDRTSETERRVHEAMMSDVNNTDGYN